MIERPPEPENNPVTEDMRDLYAQAHLQGTRYWDFTASRQQVQGQFRQRIAREHAERAVAGSPAPISPFVRPPDTGSQNNQTSQISEPVLDREEAFLEGSTTAQENAASVEPAAASQADETPASHSAPYAVPPRREPPAQHPPFHPEETRWFALHSMFAPQTAAIEPPRLLPWGSQQPFPILAVASLAGGVGKTCMVATLGRALSAFGENVLLADTNATGLLPFYYGAKAAKPGVLRTFSPPVSLSAESSVPVRLLGLLPEAYPAVEGEYDPLLARLVRDGRGVSRALVDVATANREVATRLLSLRPTLLVPILPDMTSVASLASLQALFAGHTCFYLLNQFDPSSPLHLEIRDLLQQRLGGSLLPMMVRRSAAVSEALAEGLTVIDYAHDSTAAEDYRRLADWLHHYAPPVSSDAGGVRWSER